MNDDTQARAAYDALEGIKDWTSFLNGWKACRAHVMRERELGYKHVDDITLVGARRSSDMFGAVHVHVYPDYIANTDVTDNGETVFQRQMDDLVYWITTKAAANQARTDR